MMLTIKLRSPTVLPELVAPPYKECGNLAKSAKCIVPLMSYPSAMGATFLFHEAAFQHFLQAIFCYWFFQQLRCKFDKPSLNG